MKSLITLNKDKINNIEIHCKYLIIHSPQGCSGTIYNITSLGLLPDCLGPIEFIAWLCNDTTGTWDRQFIDSYLRGPESLTFCRCYYFTLCPQLFKEPECWFSWGLNQQPLAQHTGLHLSNRANQAAGSHVSVNISNFPRCCCPFITHLNVYWTFDFVVIIFICLILSMHWVCAILYTNKKWMPIAFYTTTYLWKVAPLYPWGTPPFLKKFQ